MKKRSVFWGYSTDEHSGRKCKERLDTNIKTSRPYINIHPEWCRDSRFRVEEVRQQKKFAPPKATSQQQQQQQQQQQGYRRKKQK